VTSSAFAANAAIPSEYTCDGAQTTPPLTWSNVPKNTRAAAILIEDPGPSPISHTLPVLVFSMYSR
jgi:phosphatidylethanolamine-binding protein (PEBP) family uncharacterized protein